MSGKPILTLANAAYERLLADLLSCRIFPGDAIKINEISAEFKMNPIAIREALSKLSSDGLVTAEAQKGFRAAPVSTDELRDLTKARIAIEGLCLHDAVTYGDVDWETAVVGALHRLTRTQVTAAADYQRVSEHWAAVHADFHEALVSGCNSPLLLRIRANLFAQSERYRRLSVTLAEYDRNLNAEHRDLAAAVLARDASKATQLMALHLQRTTDILLQNESLCQTRSDRTARVFKGENRLSA